METMVNTSRVPGERIKALLSDQRANNKLSLFVRNETGRTDQSDFHSNGTNQLQQNKTISNTLLEFHAHSRVYENKQTLNSI